MIEGFRVPIHRSLTQPMLIAGAPRDFTFLNGTVTGMLWGGAGSNWGLVLGVVLHIVATIIAKKDPDFLATFRRSIYLPDVFEV